MYGDQLITRTRELSGLVQQARVQVHGIFTAPPRSLLKSTRKVSGKTVGRQLTEAEAGIYREWINNRRELQRILGEMEKASAKAGEILLREVKDPTTD